MNGAQPRIPVDLDNARAVVCMKCGSPFFITAMKVRKLSKIASPDGREHIIPIPTLVCLHCNLEIGAKGKEG